MLSYRKPPLKVKVAVKPIGTIKSKAVRLMGRDEIRIDPRFKMLKSFLEGAK